MNGKVFIIGVGLIGGSLALAISKAHEDVYIVGYDVNETNLQLAKLMGIINEPVRTIQDGVKDADLILLAVPVDETKKIVGQLATMDLKSSVIVTDAGSTKDNVVKAAKPLTDKGITFIGGHPMAGSHKSGAGAAKAHLFENAFYLLTPSDTNREEEVAKLQEWLKGTKANFLIVSPQTHDWLTGVVSHFPHIIAAGLVNQAQNYSQENELISRLAAGGFRDITRIASSSPEMWRDILLHNRDVLLELMDDWLKAMNQVKELVANKNSDAIYRYFADAKAYRDDMPAYAKGAIAPYYDLYVDVPDTPGVISEVTGLLAEAGISITNIRIVETREDIYGILVISFQTEEDRISGAVCLEKRTTYETILA